MCSSDLPIISWASDYYLNWQAQNGINLAVQTGLSIGKDIAGIVSSTAHNDKKASTKISGAANVVSGVLDVASDVASLMQEHHVADMIPDQARGNTSCGDLTYSMNKVAISYSTMSCRYEYAKMIDSFFSMFGYKVNEVKIPNLTGRQNWNFVKTNDSNIIANIPQEDLDEIKGMFNSGVTIWHNTATFMDYSQNNPIV